MKRFKNYRLVTADDIDAVCKWAEGLTPEDASDQENVERVGLIRDTILTALVYARVVAVQMDGLPCFDKGLNEKERQAAMADAARRARKPNRGRRS